MTALGALLCVAPLFNVLGYEASASVAVAASLLGPGLWWSRPWVGRPHARWLADCALGGALLAPPLVLLLLNAFRVQNCALWEGVAFYGLQAGGAVAVCALWALLARALGGEGWRRAAIYGALWVGSALSLGLYLALEPPVVAFQPVIGYFAGSIYDEALSVPPRLVLYRAWNLLFVLGALLALELAWSRRRGERAAPALWVGLAAAWLCWGGIWAARAPLGLEITRAEVEAALSGEHRSVHFVIRYDPGAWHAQHIEAVAADHELRYEELAAVLGPAQGPLRSYLYRDREQKGALLGIRNTLVAKLWLGEMHVTYEGEEDPLLTHELAHLLAARHGRGPLQLSMRRGLPQVGLVEGLAEALTWDRGELTLHGWSAAMRRLGLAPDLRNLLNPDGFYVESSARAYTLVGSFCRYLLERHGVERLLRAYADGDFAAAYGEPLEGLVSGWEAFVDGEALTEEELSLARFTFDRGGIFSRQCARRVAALRREGAQLGRARRYEEALACAQEVRGFSPREPGAGLALAGAWLRLNRPVEALEELARVEAEALSQPEVAALWELRGDALWSQGRGEEASSAWGRALSQGPPWATRRALQVRVVAREVPEARRLLLEADEVPGPLLLYGLTRWAERSPQDAAGRYLLGRQLWSLRDFAGALPHLEAAVAGGEEGLGGLAVYWEAQRLLLGCEVMTGRVEAARHRLAAMEAMEVPVGLKAKLKPWRRRLGL